MWALYVCIIEGRNSPAPINIGIVLGFCHHSFLSYPAYKRQPLRPESCAQRARSQMDIQPTPPNQTMNMTSQSVSSRVTNQVRPENTSLRRTHLQFWPPSGPPFSWTDHLHVVALRDDEVQHLLIECTLAYGVLNRELDRRKGQQPKSRNRLFKALQNINERPLQPATTEPSVKTHQTNWLLSRLTGYVFPWENVDRLPYFDLAGMVQLGLNLTGYPIVDGKYPTSTLLPVNTTQWGYLQIQQKLQTPQLDDFPPIAEDAASLVYFAGNNVPESFLSTENISWSTTGDVVVQNLEIASSFEVLRQSRCFVQTTQNNRVKYSVCAALAQKFDRLSKSDRQSRSLLSLKHVCSIFPKDGEMEPLAYGLSLTPIVLLG